MRKTAAALALLVLRASCAGEGAPLEVAPDRPVGAPPPLELPPTVPALPAFLAFRDQPFTSDEVDALEGARGIALAVPVRIADATVEGPAGATTLRVGATDPLAFRSIAPEPSRAAQFVWAELAAGQAVATFAAADSLGLEERSEVRAGDMRLTVGAYADNGVPNVADLLVNNEVGDRLGVGRPHWLVVGANPAAAGRKLDGVVERALAGAHIAPLLPDPPDLLEPDDPEATGEATGSLIGTMSFRILEDGFIKPDEAWVDANIATANVPIIGEVTCHRLLIPQLHAALDEVSSRGLGRLIRPQDYGGCYVPRFIDRDPSNPLSMHAFGLAVDVNVSTNLLGTVGDQDPRVVAIFERWGFEWGGRWSRPDPMHFELARLVRT